jgi:hypothetical protein
MMLTSVWEDNSMLNSLYEFEKENKYTYDAIKEYCLAERVDEEYFRASIVQKRLKNKLIKSIMDILHIGEKVPVILESEHIPVYIYDNKNQKE